MLRTGLKIFAVLAALVAILLGYFYFFDRNKVVAEIFDVFDENGIVVRFNQPNNILTAASSSEVFQEVLIKDSLLFYAAQFLHGLAEHQSFKYAAAVYIFTDSVVSPVYVVQNHSIGQSSASFQWVLENFYKKYKPIEKFVGKQPYYAFYRNRNVLWYMTESNGVILWGNNVETLLKATLMVESFSSKTEQAKLVSTAGSNAFANVFIRPKLLSSELKSSVFREQKSIDELPELLVLDVHLKNSQVVLSGLSSVTNLAETKAIAKAGSRSFSMPDVVPEQSDVVYQLGFRELYGLFQESPQVSRERLNWLTGWADDELVFFRTNEGNALAFKVKGQSIAHAELQSYISQPENKASAKRYVFDKSTDFEIIHADFNWVKALLPHYFTFSEALRHAALTGEYVVFTTNASFAEAICRNTVLQQNLKSSYRFKEQSSALSSSSNRMVYKRIGVNGFESFLSESAFSFVRDLNLADLFQYLIWQSSGSGQYIYNHIVLYKSADQVVKSNVRWKTKLAHNARIKPVMMRNHVSGKTEIMVQDEKYYLYLINDKGRVLWQKMLDGNVLGEITQVDKYRNGKLQYLFNTPSTMYLVDRNGNDVERFPMKFPAEASTGLAVFDYEQNRNYRIFVPLSDRRVLLYDIDANLIPGWQFTKSDAIVSSPVQFVRVQNKDFIFFADSLRHYFLDRQGEHRVKPSLLVGKSANNPIYFNSKSAQWISSSVNGDVIYTSLDGSVKIESLDSLTGNHYFLYADVNRDGKSDYIFIDGVDLHVYNYAYKRLFDYRFSNQITEAPSYYVFSSHLAGVGVVDKQAGKVYMFNSQGKQFNGYPYPGVTPFTISTLTGYTGFHLVVGNFDGFLYTYQLK